MRARWPKYMIIPDVDQFRHGTWVTHDRCEDEVENFDLLQLKASIADEGEKISKSDVEELRHSCGTQCCLVGWAALAFDERGCTPHTLKNPATARFLNKFVEFAGFKSPEDWLEKPSNFVEESALRASDVFETCGGATRLSPEKARELWIKTAEHFGYDTKNLVE